MESDMRTTGEAFLDRWPAEHLSIAVVSPDEIVGSSGDLDRPYRLASVTKPLVATAALVAVEEGALSLDQPSGPPGSTIRHLLCHASGLGPDDNTVLAAPGTRRIYSNQGFAVLGEAIEAGTGFDLAAYLHEGVCAPLDMFTTRLAGHPGHGAVSTAADLARFIQAWLGPHPLLDPSTVEQACTAQFGELDGVLPGYGTQKPNPWGLGFEIKGSKSPHWTGTSNSPGTVGHFGQSGTFIWIDRVRSLGVVALGDADFGPWAVDIWTGLNDAIVNHFAPTD